MSGSGNTSETALRVTSRADELAFAPAYQASTIVRSSPKAVIATTMPRIVSVVRSLWRNALRSDQERNEHARDAARSADQHALLEVDQAVRLLGGLGSWVTMMIVLPSSR